MKHYLRQSTKQFRKDLKRLKKAGFNLEKIERVVDILSSDGKLEASLRDHELKSPMRGMRECHIAPDWLLTYHKDHHHLVLVLIRTGDHRNVLGIE